MKKTVTASATSLLFFILILSQSSFAQNNLNAKLPIDSAVKIGKLSNGLTYYIRKNAKPEKKVQLRLVVNAGSVLEDADQQGLAHFMEHMNFNGLKHFPKNELVNYLQSIGVKFGADLNAQTSFDETIFILPIPTDNQQKIDSGFTILEDWAGNALLDTTEINKERGVVLEESRLNKNAQERMMKQFFPKLFNGSLYANRLPIGKDSILEHFKPETLKRFYKTWYRPNLMAVIVVGDIDPALAEKEIDQHFGHFKNPATQKPRPSIIPIPERKKDEAIVVTDKENPMTILAITNFVVKKKNIVTWADYKQNIVEDLFNSILNQRISELTKQANPPFVFGGASFEEMVRGYREFSSFAVVGDKPVKEAINALITTTEAVKKFGFLQTELERAKSNLLNETENALKDKDKTESIHLVQGYINNYLSASPIIGITNRYNFIKDVLPKITLEDVNAYAKKMESAQGKFMLVMGSEKNKDKLPSNENLLTMLADAHKIPVKAYEEKVIAKSLISKQPVAGKIISQEENSALGTTNFVLSNGVTVTLKPTEFKNDDIQLDAWRLGGFHNYNLADKQNAEYAANIVSTMGVADFTAINLEKFLSGKTVNVQPYINPDEEGIQGNSSVKDIETFFQLIHLYFAQPRKDEAMFQSFIAQQKGFLQNLKANPFNYFADTLSKIEFQNNPWAGGIPDASDFDKIKLERSFAIYKEIFGNAYGLHFTFVGNIDVNKIKPLIETYLASLPAKEKENKFTDVGVRPVKGVVQFTIAKGAAKQSQVNIIFNGEANFSDEEYLKIKMLTDALNIKVVEKLREEMSGIYTGNVSGGISKRPYNHYTLAARFPCGPENVEKLTQAMFGLIKNVQENGVDEKDLAKVKETLQKHYQDQIKQNDYWLNELSMSWINGEDGKWILDYSKKVNAITTNDLQEAAKKYFNFSNYIKAVLNPEK
ncbi:MAG: insulinase family protein [Bacteroidota bacterium]|nr:insulinase family protein [Bacteroidota bacterium]